MHYLNAYHVKNYYIKFVIYEMFRSHNTIAEVTRTITNKEGMSAYI